MEMNLNVLDIHGNNAAVRCPSCSRVFVVSKFLDKLGRLCPGCGKTRAILVRDGRDVTLETV
jgi:NAD-dependent SIR2 family protein deacetylase